MAKRALEPTDSTTETVLPAADNSATGDVATAADTEAATDEDEEETDEESEEEEEEEGQEAE